MEQNYVTITVWNYSQITASYNAPPLLKTYPFLLFIFSVLHFLVVVSVRQIKLTHVGFRAHVKIASRIVEQGWHLQRCQWHYLGTAPTSFHTLRYQLWVLTKSAVRQTALHTILANPNIDTNPNRNRNMSLTVNPWQVTTMLHIHCVPPKRHWCRTLEHQLILIIFGRNDAVKVAAAAAEVCRVRR